MSSNIDCYLKSVGQQITEGHVGDNIVQALDLLSYINGSNMKVMEIGFNAGHSSELFLKNNDTLSLISFDIGSHNYLYHGKKYIDQTYPSRHTLILGDSTKTVPIFINSNPNLRFDVIFIDGGHDYETAKQDLENSLKLCHKDTIILLDDTQFIPELISPHNQGPSKVWQDFVNEKKIIELKRISYSLGRGMCVGKKYFNI